MFSLNRTIQESQSIIWLHFISRMCLVRWSTNNMTFIFRKDSRMSVDKYYNNTLPLGHAQSSHLVDPWGTVQLYGESPPAPPSLVYSVHSWQVWNTQSCLRFSYCNYVNWGTGDFMKKVPQLPVCIRDRYMYSLHWMSVCTLQVPIIRNQL